MEKIVCVRFLRSIKTEYFDSSKFDLKIGDSVVVETERGKEIAKVVKLLNSDDVNSKDLSSIIRIASKDDIKTDKSNVEQAREILKYAKNKANELDLNMKFLTAEYTLDKSRILLYFTAEDRVDFRELVKALASEVKTRIELRQIGPRDEVKMYESIGICGKETCCRTHLKEFKSVTIKDAKEQGLQINMDKLSGSCGKLMCCLKYEEEEYKENQKNLPKYNETVTVKETGETGKVCNLDILKMKVRVKFGDTRENERIETFDVSEISWKRKEN